MKVRAKIYKLLLRLLRKRIGKERPDEGVLITQRLRGIVGSGREASLHD